MFSILIIALCTQPTTCLPQPLLGIDRGVDGAASAVERREFAPLPQSAAGQRENRTAWAPQSWAWGKHGDERGIGFSIGHQFISYSFNLFHFAITSDTSAPHLQYRSVNLIKCGRWAQLSAHRCITVHHTHTLRLYRCRNHRFQALYHHHRNISWS